MGDIITICGSMRFKSQMVKTYNELTEKGNLVFLPFSGNVTVCNVTTIHKVHEDKIRMSDYIMVIDQFQYIDIQHIGSDTQREIDFANSIGKPVKYLSKEIQ